MIDRVPIPTGAAGRANASGNYFTTPRPTAFFTSGCKLLDLALGGGWAESRISNVVGDRSTGKTLLAIEAAANFAAKHSKGRILYRESEAAFDQAYAKAIGMPVRRVDFGKDLLETVEDMFEELDEVVREKKRPTLYIMDSLDALSDRDELARNMDKGSFGASKAKKMSELFRRLVHPLHESTVTLMIISQVRDNIGVMFGSKTTRSGGRALDFYASQTLVLHQRAKLFKTIAKVKRTTGIQIRAYVDKNKVGLPFRECEFPILFGYGIDDARASRDWLLSVGHSFNGPLTKEAMDELLSAKWYAIEDKFLPTKSKYGGES